MKLLPPEPTYEMLRALAGDPPLLAASDEAELRKRYQAMRDSAPEYVLPPSGMLLVPEKPVAWRREWDGDDSDIGIWIYEEDRPGDGKTWQALYAAEPE